MSDGLLSTDPDELLTRLVNLRNKWAIWVYTVEDPNWPEIAISCTTEDSWNGDHYIQLYDTWDT